MFAERNTKERRHLWVCTSRDGVMFVSRVEENKKAPLEVVTSRAGVMLLDHLWVREGAAGSVGGPTLVVGPAP